MKRLALTLLALTLAACAPVAQFAQPNETATLTLDGRSVVLTNPGPDALTGDPSRPGDGVALTVTGDGLVPDAQAAAWCQAATTTRWACALPEVPAGNAARVTFTAGTVTDAAVFAYRPGSGARPVVVWLAR